MTPLAVAAIEASSTYVPRRGPADAFAPARLLDPGEQSGGWISGLGAWRGAWVEFAFARPTPLALLEIANGLIEDEASQSRDDFYFHLRVAEADLTFDRPEVPPVAIALADAKAPQRVRLAVAQPVGRARLAVRAVHRAAPDPAIVPFDVVGMRRVRWFAP